MKRYLVILIAIFMIFSLSLSVHGEENQTPSTVKLNLEQAYKLMEANNLEIKLLDKKIEIEETQYEDIWEQAEKAKTRNIEADMQDEPVTLQMKKDEVLTNKQEWLQLNVARNDRKEKLETLKSQLKEQYINQQLLQEDILYIKEDIAIIDKKLEEVKLRIQLGQSRDSEYESLYSQKLSLQNQLNVINTQYLSTLINIKKTMGLELSQPIELEKIVLPYEVVNEVTLKADMLASIENSFSIYKLKKEIELKNLEIQLVKQYTDYRFSSDYKDLCSELSEIEAELAYEKLTLEAELWIDYYNLLILKDNIELEKVNTEVEKINYDSIMAKSKLGLVNAITESNARLAYNRQKNNYQRAMYNYILAVEQLNNKLNIEE